MARYDHGFLVPTLLYSSRRARRAHESEERLMHRTSIVTRVGMVVALTIGAAVPALAAHPGANGRLAFASYRAGNRLQVFSMAADGSDPQQLTLSKGAANWSPSWSPDGMKIAYQVGTGNKAEIYVMNANGSGAVRLTKNRYEDLYPVWSPLGDRIAVTRYYRESAEIVTFSAVDGLGDVRLTNNTSIDIYPTWSPDGSKIAFGSDRDGDHDLYVMASDGTGPVTQVTTNGYYYDYAPDFSPDGSKLVYIRQGHEDYDIYTIGLDGSGITNLTNSPDSDEGQPDWSPDGTKIAYVWYPLPTSVTTAEVFVMNAHDGSGKTRLTTDGTGDVQPDWQTI
ncbi:MAG TPA: hypothetical protein VG602_00055 [Actinomycetota bacterium]|nr:hypothetical protein [Actinomycetota bacterium]